MQNKDIQYVERIHSSFSFSLIYSFTARLINSPLLRFCSSFWHGHPLPCLPCHPPSFLALLFHLPLNSFLACILQFSVFCPGLFLSLFSLFSFPSCSAARPPILLTNAQDPSAPPVHRNPPLPPLFSRWPLPTLFSFSRSYPYLPAIIRFHWPSVPRRGNSSERLPYLHVWG